MLGVWFIDVSFFFFFLFQMQDNDIILCDGHCDRAYHVKCLVPPVDPATLPEDEGWLCPSCDRKVSSRSSSVV